MYVSGGVGSNFPGSDASGEAQVYFGHQGLDPGWTTRRDNYLSCSRILQCQECELALCEITPGLVRPFKFGAVEDGASDINSWATNYAPLPSGRYGTVMLKNAGNLYVLGGRLPNGTLSDMIEIYRITEDKWYLSIERLPTPRASACAVSLALGEWALMGGVIPNGDGESVTATTDALTFGDIPPPPEPHTYVFEQLPSLPLPVYDVACTSYRNFTSNLLAVGGQYDQSNSTPTSDTFRLNMSLVSGGWLPEPQFYTNGPIRGVACTTAAVLNNGKQPTPEQRKHYPVCSGGETGPGSAVQTVRTFYNSTWHYAPEGELHDKRAFHAMTTYNADHGWMLVIGGNTSSSTAPRPETVYPSDHGAGAWDPMLMGFDSDQCGTVAAFGLFVLCENTGQMRKLVIGGSGEPISPFW